MEGKSVCHGYELAVGTVIRNRTQRHRPEALTSWRLWGEGKEGIKDSCQTPSNLAGSVPGQVPPRQRERSLRRWKRGAGQGKEFLSLLF